MQLSELEVGRAIPGSDYHIILQKRDLQKRPIRDCVVAAEDDRVCVEVCAHVVALVDRSIQEGHQ